MSMNKSLKSKSTLERHRNVLTRAERIGILKEEERWKETSSPLGLPKVSHRKAKVGKKAKDKKEEAAATPGTEAAAAPAATAAKPAAKPAK
jgi:small basic protein (TIGR04137 family)